MSQRGAVMLGGMNTVGSHIEHSPLRKARFGRPAAWKAVFAALPLAAVAQGGNGAREFWFAPPDVSDLHGSPGGEPLYLSIAAGDRAATVVIDLPANGAFTPMTISVPARTSARVNLTAFKSQLESRPTNTIVNSGLHIVASQPVAVSYDVANVNNAEQWNLRGGDDLGTAFVVPLPRHAPFGNDAGYAAPHQAFASFDIVATQPNTLVRLYSPVAVDGHPPLQQWVVTLNRGQVYSAGYTGANWFAPATHPGGAVVLADKPVAVSIKDDSVGNPSGPCRDLIGDQLVPAAAVGREYVVPKGGLNASGDESLIVYATQNDTALFLDGAATPAAVLFAGEYRRIDLDYLAAGPDNALYLRASQPVYAAHVSGIGCEMGMALLPPLESAGSYHADFVRADAQPFSLLIVVPTIALAAFDLRDAAGNALPLDTAGFRAVPGTGGVWQSGRVSYDAAILSPQIGYRLRNSAARFLVAALSGSDTSAARYGYLSAYVATELPFFADGFEVSP